MPDGPTHETLDLALPAEPDADPGSEGASRHVEVAIDVAGGLGRSYTYHVPARLADLAAGEAVLVGFGSRQAIAIVLGEAVAPPGVATKPILDRVRADGPILPRLSLALARWLGDHYLVPPATVLRAMLPPGFLERLDLVADRPPESGTVAGSELPPADADLLDQLANGSKAVRSLISPDGRAGLVRRLRAMETRGIVSLEWTLAAATSGPRYIRWLTLTDDGRAAGRLAAAGERQPGRPLGPRQAAALDELLAADADGLPATPLAEQHGSGALAGLVRRGLVSTTSRELPRRPLEDRPRFARGSRPAGASLTGPQAEALQLVCRAIDDRDPKPLLLDGVTGGGKTAIYAEAIGASLDAGRPALVLVPEIALAAPIVDRLRGDLGARVALLHSALGDGERADEWRRIRAGGADVVVGTRIAVTAPLADVGLVIVDEEHEAAYKSDRTPRLQARDVAIELARLAGAAVILGSATPAVDSAGRARSGEYRRVELPSRPSGVPPRIEVVDLRAELQAGNRSLLSARLAEALGDLEPAAGERAILAINRRGSASIVMCRDCGHVQECPDCARPLVYHQAGGTLRCHHCGRAFPPPSRCPDCASPRIRYLGAGTERVEREVRERFPGLRVGRLDRDVVERRGGAERVVDAFTDGRLDVLVGTSLVTKGLDIPEVVLVGVVSADIALNLPDERAAERTYQLLVQAVGRAGRGDRPGLAILQTYQPEHRAIRAVVEADPRTFYDRELELRERFGSPPFGRLVKLTVGLPDRAAAESAAAAEADRLRMLAAERGVRVEVVGPAPAFIARRADRWRWNVILRGADPAELVRPGVEAPWSVDVDPESLM